MGTLTVSKKYFDAYQTLARLQRVDGLRVEDRIMAKLNEMFEDAGDYVIRIVDVHTGVSSFSAIHRMYVADDDKDTMSILNFRLEGPLEGWKDEVLHAATVDNFEQDTAANRRKVYLTIMLVMAAVANSKGQQEFIA